jgi:hypothetical protein
MPRNVTEFRVIVASPTDLLEIRKAIFEVIDELNRTFEIRKVAIRGLGWEEYVTPGIGETPQDVINQQLLKEYDILIAIFATRLGTPTGKSESGTVEEIEQAIKNTDSPLGQYRVQVYFREKIDSVTSISLDDLKSVFEYRDKLKSQGVLYGMFKEREDLQSQVRVNLQRPILKYLGSAAEVTQDIPAKSQTTALAAPQDEELGFLDYQEKAETAMEGVSNSINRMTKILEEITSETNKQVSEIEAASFMAASAKSKKETINNFASFLKSKAVELREVARIANDNFTTFADIVIVLVGVQRSSPEYAKEVGEFLETAEGFLVTLNQSRASTLSFRSSVANTPRITIQYNQAKRLLLDAIDECLRFIDQSEQKIFEITAKT